MKASEEVARIWLEATVRRVVREEIRDLLDMAVREAEHQNVPYETPEITQRSLEVVGEIAKGLIKRLTCEHEFRDYFGPRCWNCGEPRPENPFETKALDPACGHAFTRNDDDGTRTCQLCEGTTNAKS